MREHLLREVPTPERAPTREPPLRWRLGEPLPRLYALRPYPVSRPVAGSWRFEVALMGSFRPRISLLGLPRSGKTSISKVVFQKMSPHDSLLLDSSTKVLKNEISNGAFMEFQVWDYPGRMEFTEADTEAEFAPCSSIVFVIDAQDEYSEAVGRLLSTVKKAHKANPRVNIEVFIHKVDGLSDDHKIECQRDIYQKATEELADAGLESIYISYYLTSIYDHSVFEAMSKVVQKLTPELATLENLLDLLTQNCRIEKAFLFDVLSKVYIATDSSPVDMQSYELCSDMIDVVIDVSCIYGAHEEGDALAFDAASASVIKLNNGMALYLRHVSQYQALVCILREEMLQRAGLLEHNFGCFRAALRDVERLRATHPPSPASAP
eukprot:tig00000663_g2947.t1